MSGSSLPPTTAPPAGAAPPPARVMPSGAPVVSVFSLALLLVGLVFAYLDKNENLLVVLAGVVATNATTVVSFYVGSSASSQSKDATISGQLPTPPAKPPATKEPQP